MVVIIIFFVPLLGFFIGLFLRLRRGKKQEKAVKVPFYSEESDFEDEHTLPDKLPPHAAKQRANEEIMRFWQERITVTGKRTDAIPTFAAYEAYLRHTSEPPESRYKFTHSLKRLFPGIDKKPVYIASRKKTERSLIGVRFRDAAKEPDAETVERKTRAAGISKDALTYHLKYTDTAGKMTNRNIKIVRVFRKNGHLYFYAFCHIALKVLMFRADRVDELLFDGSPVDNPSQLLADMVQE